MIPTNIPQKPRRRENMWALTNDDGFVNGKSPFDGDSEVMNKKSFLNKKNPFGL